MPNNGEKYVTYKWLFIEGVVIIGIVLGAVYFMIAQFGGNFSSSLDKKLDKEIYVVDKAHLLTQYGNLCEKIGVVTSTVDNNQKDLDVISKNQLLILRKMGIEPVTRR